MDALHAFVAAARHGSFSAAATELGVTHGAISRRVTAVEVWLGARLFDRHGRGVVPTPVGENLVRRVDRALTLLASLRTDVRAAGTGGAIRLSVLPSFARLWLVPRMAALEGDPADLSIRLLAEHRIASLDRREADIAVRFGTGQWPGTDAQPLMAETRFAVAAPALAAGLREPAGVLDHPLLHDGDGGDWREWCRDADLPFRPAKGDRRFDDYDLVLAAAEASLGVAIARRPLADDALAAGRLVALPGPTLARAERHFVVTRSGEARTHVLRLRDRLLDLAGVSAPVRR